jgi:MarR family transcriptional regulator, organic hydroperoxide resistance regulator
VPPALKNQIGFTLYTANMTVNRTYKPMLDQIGITYPQYLVLSALAEKGAMTIGAIARMLRLESSTVTPPVKRLERAGLINRERGRVDERQVLVDLTDAGRALHTRCDCLGETLMANSGMSWGEVEALNHQIRALRNALSLSEKTRAPRSPSPER